MKKFLTAFFLMFLLLGCIQNTESNQNSGNLAQNTGNSNVSGNPAIVKISNFSFQPQELAIKAGTTVQWVNEDSVMHQIKSDSFNSNPLSKSQSFGFQFNSTGTFNYSCLIHPSMSGKITVE